MESSCECIPPNPLEAINIKIMLCVEGDRSEAEGNGGCRGLTI